MFKCLIESDLECSLFSTYFCPQTLFVRLLLVISLKVFLLVCTHVQSVLELSVLGLSGV